MAVGVVIINRMAEKYASDGTIVGTVLHKWAFSGFWAAMSHAHYQQVAFDLAAAEARAQALFEDFSGHTATWRLCRRAWVDAQAWRIGHPLSFTPGPAFKRLTRDTVLYYNPEVSAAPPWATPAKLVAKIFDHTFYRDP